MKQVTDEFKWVIDEIKERYGDNLEIGGIRNELYIVIDNKIMIQIHPTYNYYMELIKGCTI